MTGRTLAERVYRAWWPDGKPPVPWDKIDPAFRGTFVRAADALVTEVLGRGAAEPERSE